MPVVTAKVIKRRMNGAWVEFDIKLLSNKMTISHSQRTAGDIQEGDTITLLLQPMNPSKIA